MKSQPELNKIKEKVFLLALGWYMFQPLIKDIDKDV
jgi:hypothetical protein